MKYLLTEEEYRKLVSISELTKWKNNAMELAKIISDENCIAKENGKGFCIDCKALEFCPCEYKRFPKKIHDHMCYCGTSHTGKPHETGQDGCIRYMTEPPDLKLASIFTYTEQRGYHMHPCGCWSRFHGSENSIKG